MSDNRETPAVGAPVEETEASHTEVLEAVERAKGAGETVIVVDSAAQATTAEAAEPSTTVESAEDQAEKTHREEVSQLDTEMDLEVPAQPQPVRPRVIGTEEMPSAAALPPITNVEDTPARDGEIRISPDHPMAALYTPTPAPPEIRGNRGAGVLISLLATIGFAIVYAGVIALMLAPSYPPSTFLQEGMLPAVLSISFGAAVIGFLLAMILLVLIAGRSGWWAYAVGGFLVAVAVWAATTVGSALHDRFMLAKSVSLDPMSMVQDYGLALPVIAAAVVAREASVWFGAWIGARGRRVRARNAEALAEYELALAEVQAKPR